MKKILFALAICFTVACSENKQEKVNEAIENTGDSLKSKLGKLNDTINKAIDRLPKVKVEIEKNIPISLQWIGFDKQGTAKLVKANDGWFTIKGEQTNANNEYVKIDGKIKRLNAEQLSFDGTIITYVKYNNGGMPCEKKGKQIFLKKGDRKNYRLQQMENCEGGKVLDYVDLYEIDQTIKL